MSKRTLFLIFALFIMTSVLLAVTLYKPITKPIPRITAPKEPVAQTSLMFGTLSSSTSLPSSNLTYSIPINIETQKNKVTAIQLELQYDPLALTNVSVVPGPFFQNSNILLSQINAKTGRISYAFGVGLTDAGVMGKGVVAIITFESKPEKAQKTGILFLPKTKITAEDLPQSVLQTTVNALFTVGIAPSITPVISYPSTQ